MTAEPAASPAASFETSRAADRPRERDGRSDVENAIFAATERLLEVQPLQDVRVARIIEESGVSRSSFYFYFSSKYAVINALLARMMDDMAVSMAAFVERGPDVPPRAALRQSIISGARLWTEHKMLMRAVHEHWHVQPKLRENWLRVHRAFTEDIAAQIDRERAAGMAPDGLDSRQLASMLVWSSGQLMFVAGLGIDDDLPGEDALIDPLASLWVGAIYGAGADPM